MTHMPKHAENLHVLHNDARDVMQQTMKFFGIVLGISAFGLWLVPGAIDDGAEALVRLVVSFLFLGIAACLCGAGRSQYEEEYHLDIVNHRLTHVLRGRDGIARPQEQIRLEDLDALGLSDGVLLARKSGGQEVLRLPVVNTLDAKTRAALGVMRKGVLS